MVFVSGYVLLTHIRFSMLIKLDEKCKRDNNTAGWRGEPLPNVPPITKADIQDTLPTRKFGANFPPKTSQQLTTSLQYINTQLALLLHHLGSVATCICFS